ncbi:DUF3306 domain-containing protein [Bosea sp. LjRoot237]|uniref:DUF3306 domain-containing protein n=1 Tax=Bosea sp. LjRoot237 TaxID=3342292 RepID=UPI003ECC23CB
MSRPDDEDRDEGFLGRWARRKKEAQSRDLPSPPLWGRDGEGGMPPSTEVASGADGTADAIPPSQPSPTRGEGSRAEPEPEMVEPPALDLVDKDFDLAHWLKQNVPEEWKLKALRRAWETDPMISSYLDPARDYALDWNTPGGAPGYGPLSESDNVEEMLANIFGKPPEPAAEQGEAVRNDVAGVGPSSNEGGETDSAAPQQVSASAADIPEPMRLSEGGGPRKSAENAAKLAASASGDSAAVQKTHETGPSQQLSRRRGGSATPL